MDLCFSWRLKHWAMIGSENSQLRFQKDFSANLLFTLSLRSTGYFRYFMSGWVELIICSGNCKYEMEKRRKKTRAERRNENKKPYRSRASLRCQHSHVRSEACWNGGKTLENSFYVFFDYSLEIEFMFIYQKAQHPSLALYLFTFHIFFRLDAVK